VEVDLDKKVELASVRTAQETASPATSAPIRVAITGLLTPSETLTGYAGLLAYLEDGLGQPVELIQRGTYAELNALMEAGELDVALVCPFPYIQGHRAFGMELLAAAAHQAEATHYSYLVVPADGNFSTLNDLRGKTFAFSDPNSHSGWLAPAYQLALKEETQDSFFERYVFTYHHSESVRAVADGLVDGAAVDSLVYDYLASADPGLIARTKVVAQWGPYPSPPFVVRPDLDPALKERLRHLLVTMDEDPRGQEVLRKLQLDGFAAIQDEAYDQVREMEALVNASATTVRR
jgi:phosphonate transport system substrate-binding protein